MAKGLLFIRTLTPTHPGAGTSTGAIDLMLQREVITNFPFIQGSSVKGAIRNHLKDEKKEILDKVFGPRDTQGSDLSKGALTITDASLLFYPVRSLKGLYAYITCPEILRRLTMPHIGILKEEQVPEVKDKSKAKALSQTKGTYEINGRVYFEDLNFSVDELGNNELDWLDSLGFKKLKDRLFIVPDDVFQYFVEFATQVMSRNKIDYYTGVVQTGALWTEEHLPPETYLFSYLEDNEEKIDGANSAIGWIDNKISGKVIHLGGDETVGKGFVELRVCEIKDTPCKEEDKNDQN